MRLDVSQLNGAFAKLTATHAALGLSLVVSAGLLWELRQTRQALRSEVEQGVSAGIQEGVGAALQPAEVQAGSAAAARGVVDGLVESALGPEARPELSRGAQTLGGAAQDTLEGALGVQATPPPAAQAPTTPSPPSRARRAGALIGDGVDLGLSLAEALLGKPGSPSRARAEGTASSRDGAATPDTATPVDDHAEDASREPR